MKTVWRTALSEHTSDDREGVGKLRFEDGSIYRYVQNKHTVALVEGQPVVHKFSDLATSLEKVYQATTANLGYLAGLAMAAIGIDYFGWIQVEGYNATAQVFQSQTTVKTAGDFLLGVNAQDYLDADVTMGTAPKHRRNVQLLEAVATVTTGAPTAKKCYVYCH